MTDKQAVPWLVDMVHADRTLQSDLSDLSLKVQVDLMTGWIERAGRTDLLVEILDVVQAHWAQLPEYRPSDLNLSLRGQINCVLNSLNYHLERRLKERTRRFTDIRDGVQALVRLVADGAAVQTS